MGNIVGSLFGGGEQKQSSSSSSAPWAPQQPYLQSGFQNAQDLYNQRSAQGPYQGSLYSNANQTQLGSAQQAANYAMGQGGQLAGTTANTAQTLQGGAQDYMGNAQRIAAGGAGQLNGGLMNTLQGYGTGQISAGGVSSPLSGALQNAAMQGAHSITSGQGNLQAAAMRGLQDNTGQTISSANQYANNPAIDAQIKAAEQPVLQTLNESTVPGLNRQASMGGNLNSSRAGMAEAMANRDAASQIANIEGSMRGNAYNNGLSLAAQQQEAGTNAALAAGSSQVNSGANLGLGVGNQQISQAALNANTQLSAANSGLSQQLGSQALNANTMLGANAQLGNGVNAGVGAASQAGNQAAGNLAIGQAAGSVSQNDQNAQLANNYQMWQNQNGSYQQGLLNNYMGNVSGNYGGTSNSTSTTQQPQNVLGGLVGTGLAGASLFGSGGALSGMFGNVTSGATGSMLSQYLNPYQMSSGPAMNGLMGRA